MPTKTPRLNDRKKLDIIEYAKNHSIAQVKEEFKDSKPDWTMGHYYDNLRNWQKPEALKKIKEGAAKVKDGAPAVKPAGSHIDEGGRRVLVHSPHLSPPFRAT